LGGDCSNRQGWPLTKHTILFLAANPFGTDRLALDQEARAIQSELRRSRHGENFELVMRWTTQPLDLLRELRRFKPTVVHLSGHGGRNTQNSGRPPVVMPRRDVVTEAGSCDDKDVQPGLLFESPDGSAKYVSSTALAQMFDSCGRSVKLVVLNACYSSGHAEALLTRVECVVGMRGSIGDAAATNFAAGFYGGLGENESVETAFKQGRAAIRLDGLPDSERPQLKVRTGIDADKLILVRDHPDVMLAANMAEAAPVTENSSTTAIEMTDTKPRPRGRSWTWRSSVDSADTGVVSALALCETIAASGIYAWIASRFGMLHLTISACVAPFLLMRTQRSAQLALKWYDGIASSFVDQLKLSNIYDVENRDLETRFLKLLDTKISVTAVLKRGPILILDFVDSAMIGGYQMIVVMLIVPYVLLLIFNPLLAVLAVSSTILLLLLSILCGVVFIQLMIPFLTIGIRASATLTSTMEAPLRSIREIPANWLHAVFYVDSCHPLELLPGACSRSPTGPYDFLAPWRLLGPLFRRHNCRFHIGIITLLLRYIVVSAFGVVLFVPALIYRWSLKGSALIYSPLIWIAHGATARPLGVHLQDILTLAYYRISRWFASLVLVAFAVKVYVYYASDELASWWHIIAGHRLLDAIVAPAAFPGWQIASVTNASLAWTLYVVADWVTMRWHRGARVNKSGVELLVRWVSLIRGMLSVYTIICCIYLVASLSGQLGLPPMGTQILPWR
jgi:hypothetical protein